MRHLLPAHLLPQARAHFPAHTHTHTTEVGRDRRVRLTSDLFLYGLGHVQPVLNVNK